MWLLNLTEKLLNKEVIDLWAYNYTVSPNELYHHGIKGIKWGRRRFTNKDGSLTALGMQRYDKAQKVVIAENIARAMATDKKYVTSAALNGGLTTTAMIYGSRTKSKVNSLHNSGLTNAEIAKRLNIPASSVSKILNKKKK